MLSLQEVIVEAKMVKTLTCESNNVLFSAPAKIFCSTHQIIVAVSDNTLLEY